MENMGLVNKDKDRTIKQIPVNLLVENPDNFYIVGDVEELKNSIIAAGGVRQNLIVEPMKDGRYMIVSGHRRCKAVKELLKEQTVGIPDTVPCEISTDHYGNQLLLIDTNSTSRDLTAWERVEQYKQLNSLFKYGVMTNQINGRKRDAIAKTLHESTTNIARYSAISNNLRKYYADWMKSGKLGISAAYELSKLTPDRQKDFYEQHMDDDEITLKSIEEFIHPVTEEAPAQEAAVQEEITMQEERPEADEEDTEDISDDDEAEDIEEVPEEAAQEETLTKDEPITWEEYMELRKEYKKVMRDIMDKHRLIDNYVELEKDGTYTQIQMVHNMQWAASGMCKQLDYLLELLNKMKVVRGHAEK
jgi:ParB family chromosome partitioning protein